MGLGASYWSPEDFNYSSVDAKFRLYTGGRPLHGFALGLTGGYTHVSGDDAGCGFLCIAGNADALTFGFDLGYQWLLGPEQKVAIALGGGAKRLFYVSGDSNDKSDALPTFRFSVGYGF